MKKKMTLKKATVVAGVVAMSVGLFNSFSVEAEGGSGGYCNHNSEGDSGLTNYCANYQCELRHGQGTLHGMCGTW
nr:hypothetical protein [Cytophagales bacterium]